MTALPNMPTREEVEEVITRYDRDYQHQLVSDSWRIPRPDIKVFANAARAYPMLQAAHKANVGTIEHFTNLLNEEKAKRLAAEFQVGRLREAVRELLMSADASWYEQRQGHDWKEAVDSVKESFNFTAPPTDVLERVRKMAKALNEVSAHLNSTFAALLRCRQLDTDVDFLNHWRHEMEAHKTYSALVTEALEQAKGMGLV